LHGNIKIYVDTCDMFVSQYSCNDGKDRRKELFLYWYQVDEAHITDFLCKIKVKLNSVVWNRPDAVFARISISV
jgi:hypothetical protein